MNNESNKTKKNRNHKARQNRQRKVNIQTKTVVVSKNATGNKRPGKNQRQRRRKSKGPPEGIQSGQSGLDAITGAEDIPPAAASFSAMYVDPCGEHSNSLESARVPDGALQTSASLFFRYIETITFPFNRPGVVDLGSETYSMLVIQSNHLRILSILIVRPNDGEFDDDLMADFCRSFAMVNPDQATYPEWVSIAPSPPSTADAFFTLIDTAALKSIIPPSARNGVSSTIESYRFSSQGVEILFNTPDLLNQGTLTSMRYPSDMSERVIRPNEETTAVSVPISTIATIAANPADFQVVTTGIELTVGGAERVILPPFNGFASTLPSSEVVVPLGITLRTSTGLILALPGARIRYQRNAANNRRVDIANLSVPGSVQQLIVAVGDQPGLVTTDVVEVFVEAAAATVESGNAIETTLNVISLPPVTQNSMLQANPKTVCELFKSFDGVYLPGSIMQPVFNVTHASSYRKTVFVNKKVDMSDPAYIASDVFGWSDSFDKNFAISVANFQSIPKACRPLVKVCRTVEAVPSADSILGAVATGCPVKCPEAIDLCHSFTDMQPHGFPPSYNGLGTLFHKITRVINQLNILHRDGRNIARIVSNACETTWDAARTVKGTWHALRHA